MDRFSRHYAVVKPPALKEGGTIGVVAPSGRVDADQLQRGVYWFEERGYKVVLGRHLEKAHRYFAGVDEARAEDVQNMFQNPAVDAIVCARGGVGAARVIPLLDAAQLVQFPKIFVGSSDITTLLLYFNQVLGWVTFHGPMVATVFGNNPAPRLAAEFFQVLSGQVNDMVFEGVRALRHGAGEGILTGGCLTLMCTTIGTPYEIVTDDKILFIEDVNEAPFRIDRMLSYLKTLGKFKRIRGLVFGQMPQCRPEDLPEIILDIFNDGDFPILFGFPSGHGDGTATLPFGLPVQVNSKTLSVRMLAPAVQ